MFIKLLNSISELKFVAVTVHSANCLRMIIFFNKSIPYIYFPSNNSNLIVPVSNEPRHEKTGFLHICENKDADQLRGNREADLRLCFRYMNSTIPLLPKSEIFQSLAIFCGCRARFLSDLVGNPEDRFSHNEAQIILF